MTPSRYKFGTLAPGDVWTEFYRTFRVEGWLALSAVALTNDRLHALVYYEAYCGGLCAEAGYAWLRRKDLAAPWAVVERFTRWVS